jgi:hypothetical protein
MTDPRPSTSPADGDAFSEDPDGAAPPAAIDPARVDYDPPWPEAGGRVTSAWIRGGTGTRVVLGLAGVVAVGLLGAFVFGLWHVVVGGVLKGNWNAGGFGIALASVAGILLWIEAAVALRVLPRG